MVAPGRNRTHIHDSRLKSGLMRGASDRDRPECQFEYSTKCLAHGESHGSCDRRREEVTKILFSSASGDLAAPPGPWRQPGRSAPTSSPQITPSSHLSSRPNLAFLRGRFGVAALAPASLRTVKLLKSAICCNLNSRHRAQRPPHLPVRQDKNANLLVSARDNLDCHQADQLADMICPCQPARRSLTGNDINFLLPCPLTSVVCSDAMRMRRTREWKPRRLSNRPSPIGPIQDMLQSLHWGHAVSLARASLYLQTVRQLVEPE